MCHSFFTDKVGLYFEKYSFISFLSLRFLHFWQEVPGSWESPSPAGEQIQEIHMSLWSFQTKDI